MGGVEGPRWSSFLKLFRSLGARLVEFGRTTLVGEVEKLLSRNRRLPRGRHAEVESHRGRLAMRLFRAHVPWSAEVEELSGIVEQAPRLPCQVRDSKGVKTVRNCLSRHFLILSQTRWVLRKTKRDGERTMSTHLNIEER